MKRPQLSADRTDVTDGKCNAVKVLAIIHIPQETVQSTGSKYNRSSRRTVTHLLCTCPRFPLRNWPRGISETSVATCQITWYHNPKTTAILTLDVTFCPEWPTDTLVSWYSDAPNRCPRPVYVITFVRVTAREPGTCTGCDYIRLHPAVSIWDTSQRYR